MTTNSVRRIGLQIVLASSVCGATFGLTGCLSSAASSFNPCGTILTCDPAEWDLIQMDPTQPNWNYNPTCPIPGLLDCSSPISGIGGNATTGNTTTNNTNTNSGRTNTTNTGNRGNTNTGGLGGFGT